MQQVLSQRKPLSQQHGTRRAFYDSMNTKQARAQKGSGLLEDKVLCLTELKSSEARPLFTFLKNERKAPQMEYFQEKEELASLC